MAALRKNMALEKPHTARFRWPSRLLAAACLLAPNAVPATPAPPPAGWHLVRTANPAGGPDAVAMSRSADISSDLDLAGLMLRCHGASAEVLLVVVTPFAPRAQPAVTIGAGGKEWPFDASVLSPGAELLLPPTAAALAAGPWQSATQLAVKISWHDSSIAGVIPIDGLRDALATLIANCPSG